MVCSSCSACKQWHHYLAPHTQPEKVSSQIYSLGVGLKIPLQTALPALQGQLGQEEPSELACEGMAAASETKLAPVVFGSAQKLPKRSESIAGSSCLGSRSWMPMKSLQHFTNLGLVQETKTRGFLTSGTALPKGLTNRLRPQLAEGQLQQIKAA